MMPSHNRRLASHSACCLFYCLSHAPPSFYPLLPDVVVLGHSWRVSALLPLGEQWDKSYIFSTKKKTRDIGRVFLNEL